MSRRVYKSTFHYIVFLLLFLNFQNSKATLSCTDLFSERPPISSPVNFGTRQSSIGQLNHIFFSMTERLHGIVSQLSSKDVNQIGRTLQETFPVALSEYTSVEATPFYEVRVPHLQRTEFGDFFDQSEDLMNDNVQGGVEKYRIMDRRTDPQLAPGYNLVSQRTESDAYEITFQEYDTAIEATRVPALPYFESADEVIWLQPSQETTSELSAVYTNMLQYTVTLVGEYGSTFTKKMVRTSQIMQHLIKEHLSEISAEAAEQVPDLLAAHTARWDTKDKSKAPLNTMLEGAITLQQFFALALARKIQGIDDGETALFNIIFNGHTRLGLVSNFTLRSPLGLLGPMAVSGRHFDFPLVETLSDGSYALTEEAINALTELKSMDKDASEPRCCPMAVVGGQHEVSGQNITGLQRLAELYWAIFESID